MHKKLIGIFLLFLLTVTTVQAQHIKWKKKTAVKPADLELFHSTMVANLPTAEIIKKGELEYEIAHRFLPAVGTEGAYFGIDGPAHMRMALAYGITNHLLVNLGRSNFEDNVDLRVKYKALQLPSETLPMLLALRGGVAWNTQPVGRDKLDAKNFQYYGQLIVNAMWGQSLAFGVVPSYLYNSHIYCKDTEYSFTIGSYVQYFVSSAWSVFVESNNTVTGYRHSYDSITLGIDLETGGHFFKIFFTNTAAINPSQYIAGADMNYLGSDFKKDWRLGFNITRILKF